MEVYSTVALMLTKGTIMINKGHKIQVLGNKIVDDSCVIVGKDLVDGTTVDYCCNKKTKVFIMM